MQAQNLEMQKEVQMQNYNRHMAKNAEKDNFKGKNQIVKPSTVKKCMTDVLALISKLKRHEY